MNRVLVLALPAVLLLAGCLQPSDREGPATDPGAPDVSLAVEAAPAAGRAGEPVHVVATVTNRGLVPVRHVGGCDPVVGLGVLGPDGEPVLAEEPVARCEAFSVETLAPGETKEVSLLFDGRLWGEDGAVAAPSGTYAAVAAFRWWTVATDEPHELPPQEHVRRTEARATFAWEGEDAEPEPLAASVRVDVTASNETFGGGNSTMFTATVTNTGETSVWYNGICEPLFHFSLSRDGERVEHAPPMAICMALSPVELAPGESLSAGLAWNGTRYEDETPVEAEPGTYTMTATFRYWSDPDFGGGGRPFGATDVTYEG